MKRSFILDLLIIALGLAAVCASARGQALPDAPSTAERVICYWNADSTGTLEEIPCEWVPVFKHSNEWKVIEAPPKHTSFFKGRRYTDPPLRSNREIFHSKSFIALNIGIWASVGANLARNWDGRHLHNQPHGGELLLDACLPAAVNSVMVWGSYKFIWAPIGVGTAGYGTFVNARSAITGVYF